LYKNLSVQEYGKKRFGFTLTEMAIVLGIAGVIIGAIWVAAGNVSQARKATDAATELQIVVQNMLSAMQGQKLQTCSGSTNLTSCMLTAGIIPSSYQDSATSTQADSPWSIYSATQKSGTGGTNTGGGGMYVWAVNTATLPAEFRVSFYNVTYAGCISLLLAATNCQAGQAGCPVEVWTNYVNASDYCVPNATGCQTAASSTVTSGWADMTPANATTLCGFNSYTSATKPSSIDLDYMLE